MDRVHDKKIYIQNVIIGEQYTTQKGIHKKVYYMESEHDRKRYTSKR